LLNIFSASKIFLSFFCQHTFARSRKVDHCNCEEKIVAQFHKINFALYSVTLIEMKSIDFYKVCACFFIQNLSSICQFTFLFSASLVFILWFNVFFSELKFLNWNIITRRCHTKCLSLCLKPTKTMIRWMMHSVKWPANRYWCSYHKTISIDYLMLVQSFAKKNIHKNKKIQCIREKKGFYFLSHFQSFRKPKQTLFIMLWKFQW